MESAPQSPNEVLTPYFVEDKLYYIPVVEYYVIARMTPAEALAHIALNQTLEND